MFQQAQQRWGNPGVKGMLWAAYGRHWASSPSYVTTQCSNSLKLLGRKNSWFLPFKKKSAISFLFQGINGHLCTSDRDRSSHWCRPMTKHLILWEQHHWGGCSMLTLWPFHSLHSDALKRTTFFNPLLLWGQGCSVLWLRLFWDSQLRPGLKL